MKKPELKLGPIKLSYIQIPYDDRYLLIELGNQSLKFKQHQVFPWLEMISEFCSEVVKYDAWLDKTNK